MFRSSFVLLIVVVVATSMLLAASAAPAPVLPSNSLEKQAEDFRASVHHLRQLVLQHVHRSKGFAALARLLQHIHLEVPPLGCDLADLNTTMDCPSAQNQFNNITTNCPVSYIANGFNDPLSLNDTVVQEFCSGSCVAQINRSLAQVIHSCWSNGNFDSNSVGQFQDALVASQVGCIKDDQSNSSTGGGGGGSGSGSGSNSTNSTNSTSPVLPPASSGLCLSRWKQLSTLSGFLANGTLTRQQLSQACASSCLDQQYSLLVEFGQQQQLGTTGFNKLLCSKIQDQWCALVYQQVEFGNSSNSNSSSNGTTSSPPISGGNGSSGSNSSTNDSQLIARCQPCYRRFVQGAFSTLTLSQGAPGASAFSVDSFTPKVNHLSYQCARDQNGHFCVDKISSASSQNVSECGDVFDNIDGPITASCSVQCASQIQTHINQLGCCTMSIFQQRLNGSLIDGDNPSIPQVMDFIQNKCNLSMANSCATQMFNFTLALENVREDWSNDTNNLAAVNGAMRRDLFARFAVPMGNVNITSFIPFPVSNSNSNSNSSSGSGSNSSGSSNSTLNGTTGGESNNSANSNTSDVICVNGTRRAKEGLQAIGYLLPQSPQDIAWIQQAFPQALAQDDLELANTATSIPLPARVDPLSPLAVNQTASNVTLVNNPSGGQGGTAV